MATSTMDVLHFHHTRFYCEENVYLLCKKLSNDGIANAEGSDLFVVFISNEKKQIPLWNQKSSHRADGVILWDYHVICIQIKNGAGSPLVWDLDSSLPFPSPLPTYVSETIRPSFQVFSDYNRLFRVVHAPIFLRCFASDRRHMKDSGGNWIEEPPPHEPIVAEVLASGEKNIEVIDVNLERDTYDQAITDLIDGTVHNLNEYNNISVADALTDLTISSVKDAIFTQKHGVVIKENQLEELICQISSLQ